MSNTRTVTLFAPRADGGLTQVEMVATPYKERRDAGFSVIDVGDGDEALRRRARQVLELARFHEPLGLGRWLVTLYLDPSPEPDDRGWELAAVIADRMARGLLPPEPGRTLVLGRSDAWELGRVQPLAGGEQSERLRTLQTSGEAIDRLIVADPGENAGVWDREGIEALCRNATLIGHLGELHGLPDPYGASRTARAWFPLKGADGRPQDDHLAWLEVTVIPVRPTDDGNDPIACAGDLPQGLVREAVEVLTQARRLDGRPGRWRTILRFGQSGFSDDSYQLALVMADRIARGRDLAPQGRLIATGKSTRWAQGAVEHVGGEARKLDLILRQVADGDRVLVPQSWRAQVRADYRNAVARRGARLGLIASLAR